VILHRKNSLFYKTENGARVGDLFMSLIYTCQLSGANAFEYLTELQEHLEDAVADPAAWMPWNYRGAIAAVSVD
jgi:transposase